MKAAISYTFIVVFVTACSYAKNDPFKIYQVTLDGSFHFTYLDADITNKEGVKAVTVRTFFLETKRHDLLPQDLTYEDFLKLTPEEIQSLIAGRQATRLTEAEINHASVNYVSRNMPRMIGCASLTTILPASAIPAIHQEAVVTAAAIATNELPEVKQDQFYLPWVVKVIVDAEDGYQLPDFQNLHPIEWHRGTEVELPETVRLIYF